MLLIHKLYKHKRKWPLIIFIIIFLVAGINIIYHVQHSDLMMRLYYWQNPHKGTFCHYLTNKIGDQYKNYNFLPDISDTYLKPGKSIFFIETSCASHFNGKLTITARQACAVESAARINPNRDVYLLYSSPGVFYNENTESDRFLQELLRYPNIFLRYLNVKRFINGTAVEKLWKNGQVTLSEHSQSHTSDVLRYLTLWKYGGIYLDLDVIVTKNFNDLGTNYAGTESPRAVAAGILHFNPIGNGHEWVESCLDDLRDSFDGHDWGHNGPGTITRLIKNLCQIKEIKQLPNNTKTNCKGFTVYPPDEFYAIPWWNWGWFFDEKFTDKVLIATNKSHIIHVWNKFSIRQKLELNSDAAYLHLAKQFCPNVVKQCDQYF